MGINAEGQVGTAGITELSVPEFESCHVSFPWKAYEGIQSRAYSFKSNAFRV